jgi:AAA+ ATPase superfamily predicted ATPase
MDNPFIFGEIVEQRHFVDREQELSQLVRDLSDGQKLFLLSPRRFGKSSLVSLALLKLEKKHVRTVNVSVSSYASYSQFLEKFAERVLRAAGPWERVRNLVGRFIQRVRPVISINPSNGETSISFSRSGETAASTLAADVFALPGEMTKNGGFRMAICLDEFQQVEIFGGQAVENVLRNEVQKQRDVGYVFSGSQPSLMEEMLAAGRPFHKAGPAMFLEKIPAADWQEYIKTQFRHRKRKITDSALERLFTAADLIPYDVQRIAHELWDYAELKSKSELDVEDVNTVIDELVRGQSEYFERLWEQLTSRQRAVLQALSQRGPSELLSQSGREEYRLGAASTVQKALQALDSQDILDRYHGRYFFVDPLFANWIRRSIE